MRSFVFSLATAGAIALCNSGVCQASLSFNQSDLLGMSVHSTVGSYVPVGPTMTPGPGPGAFADGDDMTGIAGSTGFLTPDGALVRFELSAADLAALNAEASDTLRMVVHNDNDDDWTIGIWYDAGAGIVDAAATIGMGTTATVSLPALPTGSLVAAGVFVANPLGAPTTDAFHASWSVPEATSFLVWSGLAMTVATRRKRVS